MRLGILGGGQLGRMLIQPCIDFDIKTAVLDPDPESPCAGICDEFHRGDFRDEQTVYEFGKKVDALTVEIEHVSVEALKKLREEGKTVFPQPEVLEVIRDKRFQKKFYVEQGIPVPGYAFIDSKEDLLRADLTKPAFYKTAYLGYDGRGVRKLTRREDLETVNAFPGLLEEAVDVYKEVAVVVARSASGELKSWPPVACTYHPDRHLLDFLTAPADIPQETAETAVRLAEKTAVRLGVTGLLAVEMFVTHTGDVLVNESAPRPHNSGHHTIEASTVSQFEQHLRAGLGLPLGRPDLSMFSATVNLVGEDGFEGPVRYERVEKLFALPNVHIHLYGKKYTKPFRKMGHVTVTASNREELAEKIAYIKKNIRVVA